MKQHDFVKLLKCAADQVGKPLHIREGRNGTHLSTPTGSVNLGPDHRAEINQRHFGRYLKNLGLQGASLETC